MNTPQTTNDGGPAFPQHLSTGEQERGGNEDFGNGGMSLRDWLAGQALKGLISAHPITTETRSEVFDSLAEGAYLYADAMLKAREQ